MVLSFSGQLRHLLVVLPQVMTRNVSPDWTSEIVVKGINLGWGKFLCRNTSCLPQHAVVAGTPQGLAARCPGGVPGGIALVVSLQPAIAGSRKARARSLRKLMRGAEQPQQRSSSVLHMFTSDLVYSVSKEMFNFQSASLLFLRSAVSCCKAPWTGGEVCVAN